jgi:hypothetical protein
MADEKTGNTGGKQPPPKIRINGDVAKTAPTSGGPAAPTSAPKPAIRIGKPSEAKKSTSRIDLSAATPPVVNLDEFSKSATIPIAIPTQPEELAKKSTIRIDASAPVTPLAEEAKESAIKKATVRIEVPSDIQAAGVVDAVEAAKKTTARVIIDEERAKGDTARIEPAVPEPADSAKKRTTRIDLGEISEEDQDIFKRRTTVMDASKIAGAAGEVPRTIRIKRPEGASPTTEIPPITPPAPQKVEAARKSETARIDLPPEAAALEEQPPPTRKKTIKIKRPGAGGTSTPIVIAKPAAGAPQAEEAATGEPQPHPAFTWVAVAAILIIAILIYVLAAQVGTIADLMPARFPYPGRL